MRRLIACAAFLVVGAGLGCGGSDPEPQQPTLLVTPVGTPDGTPTAADIGPDGGTVTSSDGGLTVTIPAGALAAQTTISIQPITNETSGPVGNAYRLEPDGQIFATPVTLTFSYAPEDLRMGAPSGLNVAFQDAGDSWVVIEDVVLDDAGGTIAAEVEHFTDFAMSRGRQLKPSDATVAFGEFRRLSIQYCVITERCDLAVAGSEENRDCRWYCFPEPGAIMDDRTWAVNGVDGGSSAAGTVEEMVDETPGQEAFFGLYTAPDAEPPTNPVNVSLTYTCTSILCRSHGGQSTDTDILVSYITVSGMPNYSGTVNSTMVQDMGGGMVGTMTIIANVSFVYDDQQMAYVSSAGTINATYDYVAPTCGYNVSFSGAMVPGEGVVTILEGTRDYWPYGAHPFENFTGTTTCGSTGNPEPLEIMMGIPWWSVPQGTFYTMQEPNLSWEEHLTGVPTSLGTGDIQWSLSRP